MSTINPIRVRFKKDHVTFPTGGIIQDGLVLNLDASNPASYSGSGPTWYDLSGNGNDGTLENGVGYDRAYGGSLTFNGSNQYVNFSFENPPAETVIVWARSATTNWSQTGWISSSRRNNGHIIHPNQNTKTVDFYLYSGTIQASLLGGVVPTDITIPHMYAFTTNGSNSHKIYLDGQLSSESTTSISRTSSPSTGAYTLGRDDGQNRYGNGDIYVVLRYNRELTESEIQHNFYILNLRIGI